jgi:radical SAM protein with 4Fe4S-binding SPASM domain
MELYIENKSIGFVKRAYQKVTENTKSTVYRVVLFNRGPFFKPVAFRFFKRKGIYDIEYVLFGTTALSRALTLLNRQNNKISLTVLIDRPLTKKDKENLSLARSEVKIIDTTTDVGNLEFYKKSKYILYRWQNEDTILDHDLMHIYKFYETRYQCKFGSCLGNVLYVDAKGNVHFCPWHPELSTVGTLKDKINYFNGENAISVLNEAIAKRKKCKAECEYFEYCSGGCPLEEGCLDFPELFGKNKSFIDGVITAGEDLSNQNLAVAKIVIKDITYGE